MKLVMRRDVFVSAKTATMSLPESIRLSVCLTDVNRILPEMFSRDFH